MRYAHVAPDPLREAIQFDSAPSLPEFFDSFSTPKKKEGENNNKNSGLLVRQEGLEPPRLSALEPKSSVSTNSTTSARRAL